MVEMVIDSIRVSLVNYQRVVVLKEREMDRYLPIWIGPAEADAIAVKLQDMATPRPLTHDLLTSVISTLGWKVEFILVNDLQDDIFYARICLSRDGQQVEIDSRPSDAIALAVRVRVPIYTDESVLDKAGILIDQKTGKPSLVKEQKGAEVTDEELKRLSAFQDFIDQLDLKDFGKDEG
jgi:hypothetical protein